MLQLTCVDSGHFTHPHSIIRHGCRHGLEPSIIGKDHGQILIECACPSFFCKLPSLSSMTFHALIPIAWLADEVSLMCYTVTMGRQIAEKFYTFSL